MVSYQIGMWCVSRAYTRPQLFGLSSPLLSFQQGHSYAMSRSFKVHLSCRAEQTKTSTSNLLYSLDKRIQLEIHLKTVWDFPHILQVPLKVLPTRERLLLLQVCKAASSLYTYDAMYLTFLSMLQDTCHSLMCFGNNTRKFIRVPQYWNQVLQDVHYMGWRSNNSSQIFYGSMLIYVIDSLYNSVNHCITVFALRAHFCFPFWHDRLRGIVGKAMVNTAEYNMTT